MYQTHGRPLSKYVMAARLRGRGERGPAVPGGNRAAGV